MTPRQQSLLTPDQQSHFDEAWADIHRIVRTVPKQKVLKIVATIAQPIPPQSGQRDAKQLRRIWLNARELEVSIRGLQHQAPEVARRHGVEDFLGLLVRFRDGIPIGPLPPTGRSAEDRNNADRKQMSAMLAYYLLKTLPDGAIEPTNDAEGPYRKLSKAFFEIAMGTDFGNLDHVCRQVLNSRRKRIERLVVGSAVPDGRRVVGVQWPRTPRRPRKR